MASTEVVEIANGKCPSCNHEQAIVFHELSSFPVHSVVNLLSRDEAVNLPHGRIVLAHCSECGFIWNVAFDPRFVDYSPQFEESQGFSGTYSSFSANQARRLVERYGLYDKTILEIGCGKGEFLALLCQSGRNRGIGFDPAFVPGRIPEKVVSRLTFIKDYYSERYGDYEAHFVCCRMTLEHIAQPGEFLRMLRRSIGRRLATRVFIQVPDVTRILRDCAFEDIYYEHCSYFCPASLGRLLQLSGFEVLEVRSEYDGQYFSIEARPCEGIDTSAHCAVPVESLDVRGFQDQYALKIRAWNQKLSDLKRCKKRVVVWGSGSKAVAFFSVLNASTLVEYVVDINTYRQGSFLAGTGQFVVQPDYLRDYRPDVVIIMNRVYLQEIRRSIDSLDLNPDIITL